MISADKDRGRGQGSPSLKPRLTDLLSGFDIRDWLLANDPALSRLRQASRVTLSIVLSFLSLLLIHSWLIALPPASYALAILLSVQGGLAVKDRELRAQVITRALCCATSILAVGLASVLHPHAYLSDAAFLLVAFLASAARVFGARGHAIGMFAFFSYFMGAYFHPLLHELALVALGPIVSSVISQTVRTLLLPDDWRRDLLAALEGVNVRVNRILSRLLFLAGTGHVSDADRRELLRLEERLKDAVLMAQGLVPRAESGLFPEGTGRAAELAILLFDLHLAAESAIMLSQDKPPSRTAIAAILAGEGSSHFASDDPSSGNVLWNLRRLWQTRLSLMAVIENGRSTGFIDIEKETISPLAEKPDFSFKNPVFRRTLQITLAAALAMGFGLLLSQERWFWAVLASFLVFVNTTSRGDTAIRALQRLMGTLLGIVAGLMLAGSMQGSLLFGLPMSVICIFLGFYFLQVSYATMTFFVSITLCLVYGMIGDLTLDLLLLRLEETAIGALAGGFVAFFVFPARTGEIVDLALGKWYATLRTLLLGIQAGEPRYVLIEQSQKLDAAYRELTATTRPLGSSWSVVTKPGHIRQALAIFLACTYWARLAARTYDRDEKDHPAFAQILKRLDETARRGSECFFVDRKGPQAQPLDTVSTGGGPLLAIEMVGTTLARLYPAG